MFAGVSLCEETKGRRKRREEKGRIENTIETHCICVRRRHSETH
jgi:hypothetical protein